MEMTDTYELQDLPQCIGSDAQGRRCGEPVVWDHVANRPISTRCHAHGGLMDAALMCWHPTDVMEATDSR
jgi:hypothetical protein